jgi:hypothetical protein
MIKRIVNGEFDSENSTRDITGLTPRHYEALISVLLDSHAGLARIKQMSFLEVKNMLCEAAPETKTFTEEQLKAVIENENKRFLVITEILEAINKPYENGIYEGSGGTFIIKDGKEIPVSSGLGEA